MNRKFIYLVNPISGTSDKAGLKSLIEKKTLEKKIPFEIVPTSRTGNYESLVKKVVKENITDIIICGGDGTVNQVVSALKDNRIRIGIIPMGSGNGLARAAKIPVNSNKALEIIFAGNSALTDGFYLNDKFSCMLCGLGFDAQVAHDFANQPTRGLATYIRETVKNFFTAKAYPFLIQANDTSIETEAFFISIANSNQFGNNFTIAPKASINDGLLDIVVVNKMSKLKMVYTILMQVRTGKVMPASENHLDGIHYFQAKELTIINKGKAPLHIDGDPSKTSDHFTVRVVPDAFRLLQP